MKPSKTNEHRAEPEFEGSKERWNRACSDLKNALSTWDELAKAPAGPSKDEQQLQEMKKLLKDLAKQVADLS